MLRSAINRNQDKTIAVIDPIYISMRDGTRLSARVWAPEDSAGLFENGIETYPVLLEALPYRRRDATSDTDEPNHVTFARAGYITIRLDFRGTADSEGGLEDELTAKEQCDVIEAIEYLSAQPYCTGAVGMFGYSWGGNNSLTAAANRPEALKAVISIDSIVDRYAQDIHYKNGVPLKGSVYWGALMLASSSRPCDPDIIGETWQDVWKSRLEQVFFQTPTWKYHSRRDSYWKQGSVAEKWEDCYVPVLAIGGWNDCYRDTPAIIVANWQTDAKAIVGPWGHFYPHTGIPAPTYDFHAEAISWWDYWLKGKKRARVNVKKLPDYRAFLMRAAKPEPAQGEFRYRGDWVAIDKLPSRKIKPRYYYLNAGKLSDKPAKSGSVVFSSPQHCGQAIGHEFPTSSGQFSRDQQVDDDLALVFETNELTRDLAILGKPYLTLRLNIDQPYGNIAARLVDVHPDGTAQLVSFGVLNLAYRRGFEEALLSNGTETVRFDLYESGYIFEKGHKIRLSLSTSCFPLMMPPPFPVSARMELVESYLELPVISRPKKIVMPEAEPLSIYDAGFKYMIGPQGPSMTEAKNYLDDEGVFHWIRKFRSDGMIHPEHKMESQEEVIDHWQIRPDDPLSIIGKTQFINWTSRARENSALGIEFRSKSVGSCSYRCDDYYIYLDGEVTVYLDGKEFFHNKWSEQIERDFF